MSDSAKEYVAGFAAGIATVITGHPFDTVKVKLQAHNTEATGRKYKNGLHCAARILSTEGVRGLYRGATSSFVGMACEGSLFFGMYCQLKKSLQKREVPSSKPQIQVVVPSAGCSGAIISVILCPTELVKCRMQVQGIDSANTKYNRYNGPLECALTTIRTEGIKGIFRGYSATLLRESIGNAVFFATYEYTRYYMKSQFGSSLSQPTRHQNVLIDVGIGIISGGLSGMAFWSAVLPLDVAKTVIQTTPSTKSSGNPFQTLRSVYKAVGLRGFYEGLGPTLARAFPANAATIVAWELAAKVLGINRS